MAHTHDGKYTGASFLSTAAFRFQAIQFECLRCFQLKDGFLFQPEATVHGLLWKRRSGTTSDAARDITIVFGSVMCCHSLCCSFILVRDVFPSGMESLRGKPRARDSLVVWCRPSRRNLGNTSAVARGKFRTSRSDGSSQRQYEECIVPVQEKWLKKRLGLSSSERARWISASLTETWEGSA